MTALPFNLTPPLLARGTATLLGLLGTFMGVRAILQPAAYAKDFGFTSSSSSSKHPGAIAQDATDSDAKWDANPFILVTGGRNIASGLALLALVYFKEDRALGLCMMIGLVTGVVDGLMVMKSVDSEGGDGDAKGAAVGHWLITGLCAGIGAWLVSVS